MLDHELSFIDINESRKTAFGPQMPPLLYLARNSGYEYGSKFYILEKAMLLLERKADVSRRGAHGDTVLHAILRCSRRYERLSRHVRRGRRLWHWKLSISTPKDMLILFMSAGADVFATNRIGQTSCMVAAEYGRLEEWEEALGACGYDAEEVMAHSHSDFEACPCEHQASKLMFEDYCQQLKGRNRPPEGNAFDHLWEDVDVGLFECEDEDTNSDTCEEDEQSERYNSKDDSDSDIVSTADHDDNLVKLPSEQINYLPATVEPRDEMPKWTRETQLLGDDVDLGLWSPIVGQDGDFLEQVNDQATETINCQNSSVNGSIIRYSDSFADEFNLAGSFESKNRGNTVQEDAFGFGELPASSTNLADFYDFDAYYEDRN